MENCIVKFVPSIQWLLNSKIAQLNKVALAACAVLESTLFFHDMYGCKRGLSDWKDWKKENVTVNGVDSVLLQSKKVLLSLNGDISKQTYDVLAKMNSCWKIKLIGKNDNSKVLQIIWEDKKLILEKEFTYTGCPYTDEALNVLHLTEYCLYQLMKIATQIQKETVIATVNEGKENGMTIDMIM